MESPELVVRRLVDIKQYTLARDIAAQFAPKVSDEVCLIIEESYLSHLLTVTMNYGGALEALVAMKTSAKPIITALLGKMHEFATKLFLVQVLLTYFRDSMSHKELRLYTAKELGLHVLVR